MVAFTNGGQLKRMYPAFYKRTPLPSRIEDAQESPRYLFDTATDETLYFFTNLGNCYALSVGDLNEVKPKDRGQLLSGVLNGLDDNETALYITCCKSADMKTKNDYLFITKKGMVKRTKAEDYDIRSKKYAAVNIKKDDALACVLQLDGEDDLLLITRKGMSIRFPVESVPVQGRISAGVKGLTVEEDDEIIWAGQILANDEIILFSERGYGKRLLSIDFESQGRSGKGARAFYFNKNGANGLYLSGIAKCSGDGCRIILIQKQSPETIMNKEEIMLQRKQDRGTPYLMAILDDVVTGIECIADVSEGNET